MLYSIRRGITNEAATAAEGIGVGISEAYKAHSARKENVAI